ncbi:hypothetical protein AMS68_001873 [Peltaster fructicola]|uniref:Sulfotransferase domain-containing protein n=1 Tax=Peltaster fructicola TaxID=286661 RepID=A0A6H0XNU7_9PEZI|nr:hypothetical protein AMS68_001873 [Peltaster fructicola]
MPRKRRGSDDPIYSRATPTEVHEWDRAYQRATVIESAFRLVRHWDMRYWVGPPGGKANGAGQLEGHVWRPALVLMDAQQTAFGHEISEWSCKELHKELYKPWLYVGFDPSGDTKELPKIMLLIHLDDNKRALIAILPMCLTSTDESVSGRRPMDVQTGYDIPRELRKHREVLENNFWSSHNSKDTLMSTRLSLSTVYGMTAAGKDRRVRIGGDTNENEIKHLVQRSRNGPPTPRRGDFRGFLTAQGNIRRNDNRDSRREALPSNLERAFGPQPFYVRVTKLTFRDESGRFHIVTHDRQFVSEDAGARLLRNFNPRTLHCIHEPFGDAFYYGPERLSPRYENDEKARQASGYAASTYKTIIDRIEREGADGKRVFIKDITHYLFPPHQQSPQIAPSLEHIKRGVGTSGLSIDHADEQSNSVNGTAKTNSPPFPYSTHSEPGNPTVIPQALLEQFHFTFLIRHPNSSIPSYYRCCVPPLVERTGFADFDPAEAGYDEVRRFFDYCRKAGFVGSSVAGQDASNGAKKGVEICVIDADDLLDNPEGILKKYCQSVGLDFSPSMLQWDDEELQKNAKTVFEKWDGFHDDAINSKDLKARAHKKAPKTDEQHYAEWKEKYGVEGADTIKKTVAATVGDYEYLKQFAIKA